MCQAQLLNREVMWRFLIGSLLAKPEPYPIFSLMISILPFLFIVKISDDEYLKQLKLLNNEEDLATVCSSPSQTPSRNGSVDGRPCPNIRHEGFDDTSELLLTFDAFFEIEQKFIS